jgi:hypothetical protein
MRPEVKKTTASILSLLLLLCSLSCTAEEAGLPLWIAEPLRQRYGEHRVLAYNAAGSYDGWYGEEGGAFFGLIQNEAGETILTVFEKTWDADAYACRWECFSPEVKGAQPENLFVEIYEWSVEEEVLHSWRLTFGYECGPVYLQVTMEIPRGSGEMQLLRLEVFDDLRKVKQRADFVTDGEWIDVYRLVPYGQNTREAPREALLPNEDLLQMLHSFDFDGLYNCIFSE